MGKEEEKDKRGKGKGTKGTKEPRSAGTKERRNEGWVR
jgi:hypothetical protein